MEKVQAGSLTETFRFSRAQHLMENSGAKVRSVHMGKGEYFFIRDNKMILKTSMGEMSHNLMIYAETLLDNWTLYDERLHG